MTQNTQITVTLTPELRLEQVLKEAGNPDSHLTILGIITFEDFQYMRENKYITFETADIKNASFEEKFHLSDMSEEIFDFYADFFMLNEDVENEEDMYMWTLLMLSLDE